MRSPATVPEVAALAGRLLADGVELVVMESTSDYWRLWYYLLEAHGLSVMLVNSSQARQLAGRPKTDRLDAQWLARLAEMGLLRPSFVPPAEIRGLREYTRGRLHLVHDRTRAWQRLEKLLEGALCKLTSVTSVKTKSAGLIIRAIIAGEARPAGAGRAGRGQPAGPARRPRGGPGRHDHHRFLHPHGQDPAGPDRLPRRGHRHPGGQDRHRQPGGHPRRPGPSTPTAPRAALPARARPCCQAAERLAEIPGVSLDLARSILSPRSAWT